jgi:hypothetical protein
MLSHDEFTKLLEAEQTATLKSQLARGVYDRLTKTDFSEIIEAFALDIQRDGETSQQAYTRCIETTEPGRVLYTAYKRAPSVAGHIEKHAYIKQIQEIADLHFSELTSPQQRFSNAIDTDKYGRPYDKLAHAMYQTAKSAPGSDVAPTAPEAPVDIAKANAEASGSAHAMMLDRARRVKEMLPNLSDSQAYVRAYLDPKNNDVKEAMAREQAWNLDGVGDTEYMRRQNAAYSNPHVPPGPRAGSRPRP